MSLLITQLPKTLIQLRICECACLTNDVFVGVLAQKLCCLSVLHLKGTGLDFDKSKETQKALMDLLRNNAQTLTELDLSGHLISADLAG